jgi:hypothetical protein
MTKMYYVPSMSVDLVGDGPGSLSDHPHPPYILYPDLP